MDASFTFPPPRTAIPRPKPSGTNGGPRESNALRASVLDAALELGITNNSLVAEWMFNNTVTEEDEEEPAQSPGLTHSSFTTSDNFSSSSSPLIPPTPPNDNTLPTSYAIIPTYGKPVAGWDPSTFSGDVDMPYTNESFSSTGGPVSFPSYPDIPMPPRPITPTNNKKLKKKRGDEYETDGGYLSDTGKKKKATGELSKKEEKARLKEEKREQKEQKEEERKRKKSLGALSKPSKKAEDVTGGGYDTDGAAVSKSPFRSKTKKAKSKTSSTEAGYETDGANQSSGSNLKKTKTRFFKLGSKSSRGDLREAAQPVPEFPKEPMPMPLPLPIAQRFATSLGSLSSSDANLKVETTLGLSSTPSIASDATERPSIPPPTNDLPSERTSPSTQEYAPPFFAPSPAVSPLRNTAQDRSSLSSAETSSSMSSNSRRRGFLPPSRENSLPGHGVESSISTINSSTLSAQGHSFSSASGSRSPSSPPNTHPPLAPGILKPPLISFPLTRSISPNPPISPLQPVAPLQISKPKLPNLDTSRGASPLPFSPNSPHITVSSSSPNSHITSPFSSSPPIAPNSVPPRPRNPPTDGFGPRSTLASPPPTTSNGRLSPSPLRGRRISPLLLPKDPLSQPDSSLPSPNVLAYYDIPPPSPPPMGPLPSVPALSPLPPQATQLRSKVIERQNQVPELTLVPPQPTQRGRSSPFPTKPVFALQQSQFQQPSRPLGGQRPGIGLGVRFADQDSSDGSLERGQPRSYGSPPRHIRKTTPPVRVEAVHGEWSGEEGRGSIEGLPYDAPEEEEIQGVIDQFADANIRSGDGGQAVTQEQPAHHALASRRSFEALREKHQSFAISEYYGGNRDTVYGWDGEDGAKNRDSRWSGSIYSRISIMDPDQSEEARERFVKRVEAMVDGAKERAKTPIPPVPRIPVTLANAHHWNKF